MRSGFPQTGRRPGTSTPARLRGWPAPVTPPFDGFNLAGHVGDDPRAVAENRLRLQSRLSLPAAPTWLQQRHSSKVVEANPDVSVEADGACTGASSRVCAVLTADCIPLLLCNRTGSEIAAVHIGWRGLSRGIIKNALAMFNAEPGSCWPGWGRVSVREITRSALT